MYWQAFSRPYLSGKFTNWLKQTLLLIPKNTVVEENRD
jgi:hypothetical protein